MTRWNVVVCRGRVPTVKYVFLDIPSFVNYAPTDSHTGNGLGWVDDIYWFAYIGTFRGVDGIHVWDGSTYTGVAA